MNWFQRISMGLWENIEEAGPSYPEHIDDWARREDFTRMYSWAVPSRDAIEKIRAFVGNDQVIEVGSGKALWAKLMQDIGINVIPTDLAEQSDAFTKVYTMEGQHAVEKFSSANVLMLVWPPYNEPMAANVLKSFRGNKLIYVGEDWGGCTGDECFHEILEKEWKKVDSVCIPKWVGLHDCLYLYIRL